MASHKNANRTQAEAQARQARQLRDFKKQLRKSNADKHLSLEEQLYNILLAHKAIVSVQGEDSKVAIELLKFASSYERTIEAQKSIAEAKAKAVQSQ
jgi:hypothetical protein